MISNIISYAGNERVKLSDRPNQSFDSSALKYRDHLVFSIGNGDHMHEVCTVGTQDTLRMGTRMKHA